ncbi:MAG: hypothetical protein V1727_01850 [Candidatus Omnitrophota bacterium]
MKINNKIQGIVLLVVGVLGSVLVGIFDVIVRKPMNDLSGPKSIIGFAVCAIFVFMGVRFLLKESK